MRRKGYHLTRYADDWVVTCRTRAEAVAALQAAANVLGGTVEYTPEPDFHGIDRFTYVVDDGPCPSSRPCSAVQTPWASPWRFVRPVRAPRPM